MGELHLPLIQLAFETFLPVSLMTSNNLNTCSYLTKPNILIFLVYFTLYGVEKSKFQLQLMEAVIAQHSWKLVSRKRQDLTAQKQLRKELPDIVSFFKPEISNNPNSVLKYTFQLPVYWKIWWNLVFLPRRTGENKHLKWPLSKRFYFICLLLKIMEFFVYQR